MARLATQTPAQVRRVLKRNGLVLRRQARHGEFWVHPEQPDRRAQIPDRDQIPTGTLMAIIRDAKKTKDEFAKK